MRSVVGGKADLTVATVDFPGATLGNPRNLSVAGSLGTIRLVQAADRFAEDLAPLVESIRLEGTNTLRSMAAELNRRGFKSARGGRWYPSSVANLLLRAERCH
jgi:hypothetical protein